MSRFGFPIIGDLLQSGLGYSGQAASLNQSWTNAALQNSAQQAALAEARRRALEQEKLQRQAIKAQKEAQDKAQTNQWLQMGIGTAAGIGGGAVLGGLAAAPAAGGAATGGAATGASAAPAAATAGSIGATGVEAASAPALSQAAASQGAMFGSAPVSPGLGNSLVQPIGSAAIGPTQTFQPPQLQPFAGGSVGRGAALGGLLGGLGALSGQNVLGPALAMPYQQFGAQMEGMNNAANWANQANNQALGWANLGEHRAQRQDTNAYRKDLIDKGYYQIDENNSTRMGVAGMNNTTRRDINDARIQAAQELQDQKTLAALERLNILEGGRDSRFNKGFGLKERQFSETQDLNRAREDMWGRMYDSKFAPNMTLSVDPFSGQPTPTVSGKDPGRVTKMFSEYQQTRAPFLPSDDFEGAKQRVYNYQKEGRSPQEQAALINSFNFLTPAQKKALLDNIGG